VCHSFLSCFKSGHPGRPRAGRGCTSPEDGGGADAAHHFEADAEHQQRQRHRDHDDHDADQPLEDVGDALVLDHQDQPVDGTHHDERASDDGDEPADGTGDVLREGPERADQQVVARVALSHQHVAGAGCGRDVDSGDERDHEGGHAPDDEGVPTLDPRRDTVEG